ncbi:hypothetical protein L596_003399 [Steinernema carpocapsae]|uniref:Uncharacterized protein n=1 Tax=Steinernema carpocapsae TaxID=34508 RepID=A0A4U8USJ8_STECR|nr:hypothetical protein L596_003399 [Steinernema carpocapsae]
MLAVQVDEVSNDCFDSSTHNSHVCLPLLRKRLSKASIQVIFMFVLKHISIMGRSLATATLVSDTTTVIISSTPKKLQIHVSVA